jgi:hypothetical protein
VLIVKINKPIAIKINTDAMIFKKLVPNIFYLTRLVRRFIKSIKRNCVRLFGFAKCAFPHNTISLGNGIPNALLYSNSSGIYFFKANLSESKK